MDDFKKIELLQWFQNNLTFQELLRLKQIAIHFKKNKMALTPVERKRPPLFD